MSVVFLLSSRFTYFEASGRFSSSISITFMSLALRNIFHVALLGAVIRLSAGHSWMYYLEGDIEDGYPRMGISGPDDDYFTVALRVCQLLSRSLSLQRYICPLKTLKECFLEPKHEIVLDQSSLRPCRASGSPGAPNVEEIAAVTAGRLWPCIMMTCMLVR